MLFLHKLLPAFILPITVCLILIVLGTLFRRRVLALLGAALLYLSSIAFVSNALLGSLESQFPTIQRDSCPNADAIVVLSGMVHQNPLAHDGFSWTESVNRVSQGVKLFKAGKANLLIFTAGKMPWLNEPRTEADILRDVAIEHGIPASSIALTSNVENTAGEAAAVTALARERGIQSLILVTTAWHMPRAHLLFSRTGLQITPYPVGKKVSPSDPITLLDFVPQGRAYYDTEIAIREMLGSLFYRLRR